jgi:LPXTG-motif cell wall-anchored protein
VAAVRTVRAPWSSASFLVYTGGLTIFGAVIALLSVASTDHGAGAFVPWTLLIFAVVVTAAFAFRRRGNVVTAGVLAFSAVTAFLVFVGAVLDWFGWLAHVDSLSFDGFHVSFLFLELLLVVAAAVALRLFGFPLLVFVITAGSWYFVTDLISDGGDWSAVVTLVVGVVFLVVARAMDADGSTIRAFWVHVVAGLTIGGGLLWFLHDGDVDFALVALAGLAYVLLGDRLLRSSWAVLGAWGILQSAAHYADKWSDISSGFFFPFFFLFPFSLSFEGESGEKHHQWAAAMVFAAAGLVLIGLALLLARRRRTEIPAAELL